MPVGTNSFSYDYSLGAILMTPNTAWRASYALGCARKLIVYCNDGGDGYFRINGQAESRLPIRGGLGVLPPPDDPSVIDLPNGLTEIEFHQDGHGEPWYVFVM